MKVSKILLTLVMLASVSGASVALAQSRVVILPSPPKALNTKIGELEGLATGDLQRDVKLGKKFCAYIGEAKAMTSSYSKSILSVTDDAVKARESELLKFQLKKAMGQLSRIEAGYCLGEDSVEGQISNIPATLRSVEDFLRDLDLTVEIPW